MKTPHINAEYIKAWADGNEVQWRRDWGMNPTEWANVDKLGFPGWDCATISFRIKPELKPDTVKIRRLTYNGQCDGVLVETVGSDFANIRLVFDGETGKLKDAQVLASSGE